jgi:hypothetical protein
VWGAPSGAGLASVGSCAELELVGGCLGALLRRCGPRAPSSSFASLTWVRSSLVMFSRGMSRVLVVGRGGRALYRSSCRWRSRIVRDSSAYGALRVSPKRSGGAGVHVLRAGGPRAVQGVHRAPAPARRWFLEKRSGGWGWRHCAQCRRGGATGVCLVALGVGVRVHSLQRPALPFDHWVREYCSRDRGARH